MALAEYSARIEALEDRLVALEAATFTLAGVLILGAGTALLRVRGRARFSTLSVQRLQLVSPGRGWNAPDTLLAELSVRPGGRSELRMQGGSLLLMRPDRSASLHLDGAWRPPVRQENSSAECHADGGSDDHALDAALQTLDGAAVLAMYDGSVPARPGGLYSAALPGGWLHVPAREAPPQPLERGPPPAPKAATVSEPALAGRSPRAFDFTAQGKG